MATYEQADFAGGIYRGRKAPANTVFDCLNGLVNDEGHLFRRGGSAYFSTSDAAATLLRVAAPYLPAVGPRPVAAASGTRLYAYTTGGTPTLLSSSIATPGRFVTVSGVALAPIGAATLVAYGGSLKTASYSTGSIPGGFTVNSPILTGSGTSWLANVDPGMLVNVSAPYGPFVVASVDSNTQITLTAPAPLTFPVISYSLDPLFTLSGQGGAATNLFRSGPAFTAPPIGARSFLAAVGGGSSRLVMTIGNRAYMSASGHPGVFDSSIYVEVPSGAEIVGAEGIGEAALLFTTSGVWRVGNLSLDAEDDFGNVQWTVDQPYKDLSLWGDLGIAGWVGGIVAPCLDDVYVLGLDGGARAITGNRWREDGGIRALYRSYVAAGYTPGQSTVHRGHLFLPIVNGTILIDVLVCRLDGGVAWTRWAGHGSGLGYAQMVGSGAPKLLGINGLRVTNLTSCLDLVGNASEADGTTHTFTKDSNDVDLGPGLRPDTAEKVRYVYETAGGTPTITVSHAVGPEGASYTAATLKRGGGASDGTGYSAWRVGKSAERIRFRFTTSSAVTSLILRRMEVTIRQAGQT